MSIAYKLIEKSLVYLDRAANKQLAECDGRVERLQEELEGKNTHENSIRQDLRRQIDESYQRQEKARVACEEKVQDQLKVRARCKRIESAITSINQ